MMLKRLMPLCIALLLIISMIIPNQGLAAGPSGSSVPIPKYATNVYGNYIHIYFDQLLSVDEYGYGIETELDIADFTLTSTSNAYIVEAIAVGSIITLYLSKSIHYDSQVTLGMASGTVYTSKTENGNATISGFIVETPASVLHLKNTLDSSKTNLSIEHIVPYIRAASPQNVYGAEGFDLSDRKYLLSLIEGLNVDKNNLELVIVSSQSSLSDPYKASYPEHLRSALSSAIITAQTVNSLVNATQRQVDEASLALSLAERNFNNFGIVALNTDHSDPDLEAFYDELYVPYGMGVETLLTKLLPEDDVVIHTSATDNTPVMTGDVTSDMKASILSTGKVYDITLQANVSTLTELNAALANNLITKIKLSANITDTNAVISIDHEVEFRASEPYLITVRNILSSSGFSWGSNVNFLKQVSNHDELLDALVTTGDIYVDTVDGFTGTLERIGSDNQFYRSTDHTRAFVAYSNQFLGALADPEVDNIYIAQDIYLDANNVLTFPDRPVALSGPTAPKSQLRAHTISNVLTGDSSEVEIINETAPSVVSAAWTYFGPGVLPLRGSDQYLRIQFSSNLDSAAQLRVNQAMQEGVSVTDATYLDFDWYYADSVSVRNDGSDPIYFEEDIYAFLSDLPYASNAKILDPTPFSAYIGEFSNQASSISITFSEPVAEDSTLLEGVALIDSFYYSLLEDLDEDGEEEYNSYPVNYTSTTWDNSNTVLTITFPQMSLSNQNNLQLIFKPNAVKNLENEVMYNVQYVPY